MGRYLVSVLGELGGQDRVPDTAQEAEALVAHQESLLEGVWRDPQVARLQQEGESTLQALQREHQSVAHTDDYRLVGLGFGLCGLH